MKDENTEEYIKACPFCGCMPSFHEAESRPNHGCFICDGCGASATTGVDQYSTARSKWNRRVDSDGMSYLQGKFDVLSKLIFEMEEMNRCVVDASRNIVNQRGDGE